MMYTAHSWPGATVLLLYEPVGCEGARRTLSGSRMARARCDSCIVHACTSRHARLYIVGCCFFLPMSSESPVWWRRGEEEEHVDNTSAEHVEDEERLPFLQTEFYCCVRLSNASECYTHISISRKKHICK